MKKDLSEIRLMILFEQLRNANERWKYLEENRVKNIEIFLSVSGITLLIPIFGISDLDEKLLRLGDFGLILPITFLLIGLMFFIFFIWRELYFRVAKKWIAAIEYEINKFYLGENELSKLTGYDGSYYNNYKIPFETDDPVTEIQKIALILIPNIVALLLLKYLQLDKYFIIIPISILIYICSNCLLQRLNIKKIQNNYNKLIPFDKYKLGE
jgi:hypothetical protein